MLFFSHPDSPETTFHTSDHSILMAPALLERPELIAQVKKASAKKLRGRALLVAVLLALVAGGLGLFQLKDPMAAYVADHLPPNLEVQAGQAVFGPLRQSADVLESPALENQLDELLQPLDTVLEHQPYAYEFHLLNDESINAFALPGGIIVVHSGLILAATSSEEVLGVLAHEIAHVSERHALRGLIGAAGTTLILQALAGDAGGLVAAAADLGNDLLDLRYSRDLEREADAVGFSYLIDSGIDPSGMVSFFEKLRAEEERLGLDAKGVSALPFLSTHPASERRIERLGALLSDLPTTPSRRIDFDLVSFQEDIRQAVGAAAEE